MSASLDITIIVSSCDAYADCWDPFFKLFAYYWPNVSSQLILITDDKDYKCPFMDVTVFRAAAGQGGRRYPWGWNLRRCLESLETDVILYLQEDFFLTAQVDEEMISKFVSYIAEISWTHESTMHIGLCPRSSHGPFHLTEHPLLWEVDRQARYRFSLQPGLWMRQHLLKYVKPTDSAWDFEEYSHLRGRRETHRFLTVNRHIYNLNNKQIYPFDPHGGIIRGKWVRDSVVELFKNNGINVDFSQRGFSDDSTVNTFELPSFGQRLQNALRLRSIYWKNRVNEAIDSFRY